MIRRKLFIGSSTEELAHIEDARDLLQSDFNVTIWNKKVWATAVSMINPFFLLNCCKHLCNLILVF